MLKNWKTTLGGILTAASYLGFKYLTHEPIGMDDISLALGFIGVGAACKDHNVTGGSIDQPK